MPNFLHSLKQGWRGEIADLALFELTVLFFWFFAFGLRPGFLIGLGDAPQILLPFFEALSRANGDWSKMMFDPFFQGGVKLNISFGFQGLAIIFTKLGLSPVNSLSAVAIQVQIFFSYFSYRAAEGLAEYWIGLPKGSRLPLSVWQKFFLVVMIAFIPYYSGRIFWAQWLGSPIFIGTFTLLIVFFRGTGNFLFIMAGILFLSTGISASLFQYNAYGLVFGLPILIGLFLHFGMSFKRREDRWTIAILLFCFTSAFALAAPFALDTWLHFLSSDAARSLGRTDMNDIYFRSDWRDWLASIPWSIRLAEFRPEHLRHEFNYAFGPLLLAPVLMPWRKLKGLYIAWFLSLGLSFLYIAKIPLLSSLFLRVFVFFTAFRVPERSWSILVLASTIFGAAALMAFQVGHRSRNKNEWKFFPALLLLPVAIIFFYFELPVWPLEILAWGAIFAAFLGFQKKFLSQQIILVCALLAILSFRERCEHFLDLRLTKAHSTAMHEEILRHEPSLESPFTRAKLTFQDDKFFTNTPFMLGVSTISGYWHPQRRFLQLYYSLQKQPMRPEALNLDPNIDMDLLQPLSVLYNIAFSVQMDSNHQIQVLPRLPTIGGAWLVGNWSKVPDWPQLVDAWRGRKDFTELFRKQVFFLENDPKAQNLPALSGSPCDSRTISALVWNPLEAATNISVSGSGKCALVLSMNYSDNLRASDEATGEELRVFPADGAITGIVVPENTHQIRVAAEYSGGKFILPGLFFSLIFALLAIMCANGKIEQLRALLKTPRQLAKKTR